MQLFPVPFEIILTICSKSIDISASRRLLQDSAFGLLYNYSLNWKWYYWYLW